jgi:hypothetical protein
VLTEVTIENLADLFAADHQRLAPEQIRRVTVRDAQVYVGVMLLALPTRLIRQLGLRPRYTRHLSRTNGAGEATVYGTVRLTIQGRQCPMDVLEVSDTVPVLVGQIPLVCFDLVIDPHTQRLIGNPAHGGEPMFEL